eukprot:3109649-Rhodomonas_salina.3
MQMRAERNESARACFGESVCEGVSVLPWSDVCVSYLGKLAEVAILGIWQAAASLCQCQTSRSTSVACYQGTHVNTGHRIARR